ncbi:MAG: HupE/UreJ family protein, partial [Pedosphaera parvula]|nr:HupE/UreJ family protein [Pedosphaera parvula]
GVYAVVVFQVDSQKTTHTLEIDCRLFFERDPQHRCLMQLEYQGQPRMAVFRGSDTAQTFELAPVTRWERFREFTGEGIHHIWTGYDHMLFLIARLLPAVLRSEGGRWEAVERFRPALISVVKIVTAFTIAHSITLSLATLKLVSLPTRLVESAIAASVAVAALNNLWPLFRDRGWLVAFSFGLMHGFGFASALSVLNLGSGTLALALVSFNVGVEAGQLVVVALFLPVAYRLRRTRLYRQGALGTGSVFIAGVALTWMCERLLAVRLLPF